MSHAPVDLLANHRQHWPETYDDRLMPFMVALHRAHGETMQRSAAIVARHGLSLAELDVLASLRRSPTPWVLTPSELQRALFITSGGLAKVLSHLEARGLVERPCCSRDRRVKPVQLADRGKVLVETALEELIAARRQWIRERVSDAELAETTATLMKLA